MYALFSDQIIDGRELIKSNNRMNTCNNVTGNLHHFIYGHKVTDWNSVKHGVMTSLPWQKKKQKTKNSITGDDSSRLATYADVTKL